MKALILIEFLILGTVSILPLAVCAGTSKNSQWQDRVNKTDRQRENIVFPADAGVLNVKDFGAEGDGVTDDTAAIQALLNAHPNGQRIIYLPNGTYLVSGTITWPTGTPGKGNEYKNTILQGQSERGVTLKLKDNAAGFTIAVKPNPVIFTGSLQLNGLATQFAISLSIRAMVISEPSASSSMPAIKDRCIRSPSNLEMERVSMGWI